VSPDLAPLVVAGALVALALAGLAALGSRQARFRSPSAARGLAALQEVVEPEVEHRLEAEFREEDGRSAAPRPGDAAGGPR
jgi:hypothetical protein